MHGSMRVFVLLLALVIVVSGAAGCKSGGTGGGGDETTVSTPVFEDDTAAVKTAVVGSTQGTTFTTPSGEGTATVMVMPGTFPDGTTLTFTPLKDSGDGALAPGFRITSDSDAEMALPAFVVFETPGKISATADIVLYEEGSDEAVPLYVTEQQDGDSTLLVAEVTHFTVYRNEQLNKPRPTRENKNNKYQRGFKQWAIKIDDSIPIDDGVWKGETTFQMDVRTDTGDIMAAYNGQASYGIIADLNMPPLTGHAEGAWTGAMAFSPARVRKFSYSYDPEKQTDPILPGMGFWLYAEGTHYAQESVPFEVVVAGPFEMGNFGFNGYGGEVPVYLYITEAGARVEIGDKTFRGFVIGTLE
jgi:hypothetical protein